MYLGSGTALLRRADPQCRAMKHWRPRYDRKAVRIDVRMRTDTGWIDATVGNASVRGLQLRSGQPVRRKEAVEVARGRIRIVGRIVWVDEPICGLRARDVVDIEGLLADPIRGTPVAGGRELDRRAASRPDRTAIANKGHARMRPRAGTVAIAMLLGAMGGASLLAVTSSFRPAEDVPAQRDRSALAARA